MRRITFALLLMLSTGVYAQISLASPQDYQVFQRRSRLEGNILIRGQITVPADAVEARVNGTSLSGVLLGKWKRLSLDKASGDFHASLATHAGGYYTVEVRLLLSKKPVSEITVQHVGVGEVFVVSGQSNSTNWGEQRQTTQTGMVTTFSGTSWRIADDPQPGVQDNSYKGSFIPPFGDALYRKYHVPIGIASVGRGATSIRQWLPAGEPIDVLPATSKFIIHDAKNALVSDGILFNEMTKRIQQLGKHGFRALLWDQGQSDSSLPPEHQISGETFQRMTELVIRTSQKNAQWKFPWFLAEGTYMSPQHPFDAEIQNAQRNLWRSGIALEGPNTDAFTGKYRQNNGLGVHYNDAGLKVVGAAWAEKVESYLDKELR